MQTKAHLVSEKTKGYTLSIREGGVFNISFNHPGLLSEDSSSGIGKGKRSKKDKERMGCTS
jgi:hypothetical protein